MILFVRNVLRRLFIALSADSSFLVISFSLQLGKSAGVPPEDLGSSLRKVFSAWAGTGYYPPPNADVRNHTRESIPQPGQGKAISSIFSVWPNLVTDVWKDHSSKIKICLWKSVSQPNVLKPRHNFVGPATGWDWALKHRLVKVCLFVYSFGFHWVLMICKVCWGFGSEGDSEEKTISRSMSPFVYLDKRAVLELQKWSLVLIMHCEKGQNEAILSPGKIL